MIPLVRPDIPTPAQWYSFYQKSVQANHFTNFGPCYDLAKRRVEWYTGGHALLVTNGTVAISACASATFRRGDVIAVPDFTVPATLQALVAVGCVPLIVPTDEKTWCMDLVKLEKVMLMIDGMCVVSPFGYPVDVEAYDAIATKYHKKLIYDFAGAWGEFPKTKNPISYSLHATKNSAIGEGGICVFSTPQWCEKGKSYINFGYEEGRNVSNLFCTNGKMDEIRCAITLSMLENDCYLKSKIEDKKRMYKKYILALGNLVQVNPRYEDGSPSLCVFRIPELGEKLEKDGPAYGVTFRRYYHPLLSKMSIANKAIVLHEPSDYFEDCVALPSCVSDVEFEKVVKVIRTIAGIM